MQIKKAMMWLGLVLAAWLPLNVMANMTEAPLTSDQAFKVNATVVSPTEALVQWSIAPNYYLYQKHVKIILKPAVPVDIVYPKGIQQNDEVNGNYLAYAGKLNVPVKLQSPIQHLQLTVKYQGCSHGGFCYPPMQKVFELDMNGIGAMHGVNIQHLLTNQNGVSSLFQTQSTTTTFFIFLGLGLLLAFTPCVLPMIPIITGIIVGQEREVSTKKAFFLSLTYVIGMAIAYALAGAVVSLFGTSLQVWAQKPLFIALGSLVFVLLAFSIFELFELSFLYRWQNKIVSWSNRHEGGTFVGVFFMGVISTLIVSPCVTAPLVGVLFYIASTGNVLFGTMALFCMGIGMGIPLLLIGTSAGKLVPKAGPWMQGIRKLFGILMLAMAIWLISRILPMTVSVLLWGLLIVGTAFYIGVYLPKHIGRHTLNRGVGLVIGIAGILFMLVGTGNLKLITGMSASTPMTLTEADFTVVHSLSDIEHAIASAKANKQPLLIDFYADWCTSCVIMDKNVFKKQMVQEALMDFVRIRVDLSGNTADDEAILKYFNVVAPPTVLLFDKAGAEVTSQRIVGELDENEFIQRLSSFAKTDCDKNQMC